MSDWLGLEKAAVLNSAFWLGQAAGKIMCAQKNGRQIYFSSVAG